jgi:hypothetical protein
MKNLIFILACFFLFSCNNKNTSSEVTTLENELSTLKNQLAEATELSLSQPGLMHNVFFWLKKDLTNEEKSAFLTGVKSLGKISHVKKCYIGPPASTDVRDVVDNSFSYALLLHFDDLQGQNSYQVDPIHLKFVEDHQDKWESVIVYDNVLIKK